MTARGWVILGGIIAGALLLLALILRFYDAEGGIVVEGGMGASDQAGLLATIEPQSIDPRRAEAVVHLSFQWQAPAQGEDDTMLAATRVVVLSARGIQQATFAAGDPPGQFDVSIGIDGEEATYPFDSHKGSFTITAESFVTEADGTETVTGPVLVGLTAVGGVNGWSTTLALDKGMSERPTAVLGVDRAFSTRMFALLLLSLSVLIAMCALVAGVLVCTDRRRLEVTMLGWAAALLFALPLLRNYLPNAPPIGASLDIFVYLWVIVAAVVGLVMMVIAWIRQKRAELLHEQEAREAATPSGE